ncbi:MAG: sugar kinase [Clostridium sp.]
MKVLGIGEILLRLATDKGKRINQMQNFNSNYGGGEANVLMSLSRFGIDTRMLTAVSNNDIGNTILSYLKSFDVDTDKIIKKDKRTGIYFLEVGSGNRSSKVIYDRMDSAFSNLRLEDINIEEILEDIDMIHFSGVTLALSESVREVVLEILKKCKEKNIRVSYDSNYRANLWSLEEASKWTKIILPYINIFSAGILDAENMLGMKSEIDEHEGKLKYYYDEITKEYSNIEYIFSSNRKIESSSINKLKCNYYEKGNLHISKEYVIDDIVDRVGGGDALAAGVLYGIIKELDREMIPEFAVGASVLKHSIYGDVNLSTEEEVFSLIQDGVGKIKR